MNQGMYRAGPTAGGLPLPRARLGLLSGAVATAALLAIVVPLFVVFAVARRMSYFWLAFREGGPGMFVLLLLDIAVPIAAGIAGLVAMRGKRVSPGIFFGVFALPLFVAVFFALYTSRVIDRALAEDIVDPYTAIRINAASLSEVLQLDIFGSAVACGAAIVGALSAAAVVASIDVETATRSEATRPSAVFGAGTLVSGAAWFVGTIVVTALRLRTVGFLSVFAVFVVGTLVPLAVLAARAAPVLRTWHDPVEARRAASALLVAGLCALAASLAYERVLVSSVGTKVFDAIAGEGIDPSQKARILMELLDARKWGSVAIAMHAVLGTATFGLALAGTMGASPSGFRHPASPSSIVALSVAVFLLGSTLALSAARARTTERIAARMTTRRLANVVLPALDAEYEDDDHSWGAGKIVLHADGTGEPATDTDLVQECLGAKTFVLWADRAATIAQLARRFPMENCDARAGIVVTPNKDEKRIASLGDLAPFAAVDHLVVGVHFDRRSFDAASRSGFVTVTSISDDTIEYEGHRVKLPIGADAPPLRSSGYPEVRFVVRATDTFGHLVAMIAGMTQRFRGQLPRGPYFVEVIAPPPARGTDAAIPIGLRLLTPTTAGRIAPEHVMRTANARVGELYACFREGMSRDPHLHGSVTVRFMIDQAGTVPSATADAATTLPDEQVVACVVRKFRTFTFPPPSAATAFVTYPMTFSPTPDP